MKIAPHRTGAVGLVTPKQTPDTARATATTAREPAQQTQLSPELGMLQQARQDLDALPEVDMDKVTQLREALARNELVLDMDALSQAIVELHRRS